MHDVRSDQTPLVPPGGIDCHVRDMTVTISADVALRDAQVRLAEFDQWLPIDGAADATLGRLVSTNSTGPLRLGYGAWRDLLLGAQFRNGRGELVTAGGRTVKNVAGYDLTKFMVGQRGVFGELVTITARTWKRPDAALLARFAPSDQTLGSILPSAARPQWAILSADALLCGYLADNATIAFYESILPRHNPIEIIRRHPADDIAHRAAAWKIDAPRIARASVPPARIMEFVSAAQPAKWIADAAFGIVLCDAQNTQTRLGSAALAVGGSVYFYSPGDDATFDAPADPIERRIFQRLKDAFDPDGKLTPIQWQT